MKLNKKKKFDTKKLEKIIKNKNAYYNLFLFIIGMALSAISVSVFYSPNEVVTTGSTGLAIILNKYLNIDLSLLVLCLSSMLLVLSFLVFGINYGSKHILGTLLFPVFLKSATLINRVVNFEGVSLFLIIVIGGVLSGIGFGLVKRSNYSLGGFYVLYDIINKRFKISIGKASLVCNSIIIILSIFTFGIDKCIYAIIGLYMTSYFGDKIMLGISSNKAFYIITNLDHTVTVVKARGGYSDRKKTMLLCVIPTVEYVKMKEVIKAIDERAFFLVTDSYTVSK